MKTKAKKKTLFISLTVFLFLIIAAFCFFQFTDPGYIQTIPLRAEFQEIEPNIYVNKGNSLTPEEIHSVTAEAKERVRAFYGELHCPEHTPIIISDDEKITNKIGDKITHTFAPINKDYICVSNEYFNVDIVAHELTHAELHSYMTMKTRAHLPVWFDEGVATQNDYRERYSYENWVTKTDNGKHATPLDEMDSSSEFQCSDEDERQFHYICAKHEIAEWLDRHSVPELLELVKALNEGADFYQLYEA